MTGPQGTSPRQRLQALLSIPERERTNADWEELNELEIRLAAGNRVDAPASRGGPADHSSSHRGAGARPEKPRKKFHKRPSR
jgi:hypothetical protein